MEKYCPYGIRPAEAGTIEESQEVFEKYKSISKGQWEDRTKAHPKGAGTEEDNKFARFAEAGIEGWYLNISYLGPEQCQYTSRTKHR